MSASSPADRSGPAGRSWLKWTLGLVGGLAAAYLLLVAGLAVVMMQPPDRFGRVMAHVPGQAFAVLPFRPLWLRIRSGGLAPGGPAPDFTLATVDHRARVRLSDLRGRPVVLVFGSYT